MPELGDLIKAFSPQPGRCFAWCSRGSSRRATAADAGVGGATWRDRSGHSLVRRDMSRARAKGDKQRVGVLLNSLRLTEDPAPYRIFGRVAS